MKFPSRKGKAKDEGRGDYSHIPDNDNSDPPPQESHEIAEDVAQAVTASGSQAGPSGRSRARRLEEAEDLRARARNMGEERDDFLKQAEEARASKKDSLAKTLTRLAEMCWKIMKWLNRKAGRIIYSVMNQNAKPGEVNLHFLHVPEAIEETKKEIQKAMSKGRQAIRLNTGKGNHSENGPKILPALRKYITEWVTS